MVEEVPQVPVSLNTEQSGKLRRELDVVSGNVRVMSEMLTELTPTNCDSSDLELLQVRSNLLQYNDDNALQCCMFTLLFPSFSVN